jgi:hypothetical protein
MTGDGKYAITSHGDRHARLHLWNLERQKAGTSTPVGAANFLVAAGNRFVTGANAWAIERGRIGCIALFSGFRDRVSATAITKDGTRAIVATEKIDLFVFDIATQKQVAKVDGHNAAIRAIALTANDTQIVSIDANGILQRTPITGGESGRLKKLVAPRPTRGAIGDAGWFLRGCCRQHGRTADRPPNHDAHEGVVFRSRRPGHRLPPPPNRRPRGPNASVERPRDSPIRPLALANHLHDACMYFASELACILHPNRDVLARATKPALWTTSTESPGSACVDRALRRHLRRIGAKRSRDRSAPCRCRSAAGIFGASLDPRWWGFGTRYSENQYR